MHVLQRCARAGVSPRARCAAASACAAPAPPPPPPEPPQPLRVLCCSGDVVVFDKPAGMMVHPAPASSAVHVHEARSCLVAALLTV
jgi:23S rRNA-/tRNA-specific pseudouridylate synthase